MQRRLPLAGAWFGLVGAFLLNVGSNWGQPDEPGGKAKLRRLPEEVVQRWRAAGAEVGWLHIGQDEFIELYGFISFVGESVAKAGDLPGFRYRMWPGEGVIEKLPDPGVPFGLDLSDTTITDAGLKEVATLSNLHMLNLSDTEITDAALPHLAPLQNLQSLNLKRHRNHRHGTPAPGQA